MPEEQIGESSAPAEVVEQPVETPEAVVTEAPQTSDDVWSKPLEFTAEEESTDNKETETAVDPVAPEVVAEEQDDDEEPEAIQLEAPTDKPAPLSRRELRKVEEKFITPLRDPDAKIEDVWQGLYDLNPTRADELAAKIVEESASQYPDEWLQKITGIDGITVGSLKKYVEPTQVNEGLPDAVKELNELYGESWKDPSKDQDILDEHLPFVKHFRQQLETESQTLTEKDVEIQKLQEKLNQLEPQIESIKTEQQRAFDLKVEQAKTEVTTEYRAAIEGRSLPALFDQSGLKVAENDTDNIKSVKEYIQERFKPDSGFMSDFDVFTVSRFSDKENLQKIISRVDKYLTEATKAEVKAKHSTDQNEIHKLESIASAQRQNAKAESDRLTVLHKKASQEFLKTIPLMGILEELADANRRLQLRGEIVGTSAPAVNQTWRDQIDPNDPWKGNTLSDRAASLSR